MSGKGDPQCPDTRCQWAIPALRSWRGSGGQAYTAAIADSGEHEGFPSRHRYARPGDEHHGQAGDLVPPTNQRVCPWEDSQAGQVPLGFTQPWARVSRGPHPPLQDHVLPSHREGDLCPAEPPTPCRQSTCSEGSRPEKAGPWGGWGCGLQAQQLLCPDQGCPSSSCPSGALRLPALACSESQVSSDRRAPLPALLTPGWAEGPLTNGDS